MTEGASSKFQAEFDDKFKAEDAEAERSAAAAVAHDDHGSSEQSHREAAHDTKRQEFAELMRKTIAGAQTGQWQA